MADFSTVTCGTDPFNVACQDIIISAMSACRGYSELYGGFVPALDILSTILKGYLDNALINDELSTNLMNIINNLGILTNREQFDGLHEKISIIVAQVIKEATTRNLLHNPYPYPWERILYYHRQIKI